MSEVVVFVMTNPSSTPTNLQESRISTEKRGTEIASELVIPLASEIQLTKQIEIACRKYEADIFRESGRIISTNPACQKLHEIASALRQASGTDTPLRPHILAEQHTANAFALPNGTVCVWPKLLSLTTSEDEVAALLAHEYVHVLRGHSLVQFHNTEHGGSSATKLLQHIGLGRVAENESDILATVTLLTKTGYNPLGMVELLKKLDSGPGSWDREHGSAIDRRLNIESLIPNIHLEGSEKPLTPLSEAFRSAIAQLLSESPSRTSPRPQNISATARSRGEPMMELRMALERGAPPRLVERAAKVSHSLTVDTVEQVTKLTERCRKPNGSVDVIQLEKRLRADSRLLRRIAALSNVLAGLDAHLERGSALLNPAISSEARRFALVQWVCGESGIDLFAEGRHSSRCLLDLCQLRLGSSGERLYDLCQGALEKAEDEKLSALTYLAESYDPRLSSLLPSLYSASLVTEPTNALVWAHRETSIFLDEEGATIDGSKTLKAIEPCVANYQACLRYHDRDVAPVRTAQLASNLLRAVSLFEDPSGDSRPQLDPTNGHSLEGKVHLLYEIGSLTSDLTESEFTRASRAITILPEQERLSALVELWNTADAAGFDISGSLADFLNDRGMTFARDLGGLMRTASDKDTVLRVLAKGFKSLEPDSCPAAKALGKEFILTAAAHASDFHNLLWADDPIPIAREFMNRILLPADTPLEYAILLGEIVAIRYDGDPGKLFHEQPETRDTVIRAMFEAMLKDVADQGDARKCLNRLDWYQQTFPIHLSHLTRADFDPDPEGLTSLRERSASLLSQLTPQLETATDYLAISCLIGDIDLKSRVTQFGASLAATSSDYDELKFLTIDDPSQRVPLASKATQRLAEDLSNTGEQLEEVSRGLVNRALSTSLSHWGHHTLIDGLLQHQSRDPEEFLLAALETSRDETRLINYIVNEWWRAMGQTFQTSVSQSVYFDNDPAREKWLGETLLDNTARHIFSVKDPTGGMRVPELLERLYTATPLTRAMIVRKLLTGENGILHDKDRTLRVLTAFLNQYVDLPERYQKPARQICAAFVEAASLDELYHRMAPFITRAIFQRPERRANGEEIISRAPFRRHLLDEISDSYRDEYDYKALADLKLRNLLWESVDIHGNKVESSQGLRDAEQELHSRLPNEYRESSGFQKLDSISAIRQLLGAEGQIGARLSQVIPQYYDLPSDIAPAFAGVYDQQQGQAKPEAFRTISALAPSLIRPRDVLSPKIGAGSQATVYPLERVAEHSRVIKVLNPNAELRVNQTTSLWTRTLEVLQRDDPNPVYGFFKDQLVADIAEWLLSDIRDESFLRNDPLFRERWHGYRIGEVSIVVPRSEAVEDVIGPENVPDARRANRQIKIDEMVEGRNLTELKLGDRTDIASGYISVRDYQGIMRVLVTNYAEQLLSGLAHSNPHPGNFRVLDTPGARGELQVAILDRNYYLEYSEQERANIKNLILGAGLAPRKLATGLVEALLKTTENAELSNEARLAALKTVNEVDLTGLKSLDTLARKLKEQGVAVPLRYTLLLVNINALDKMCRDPGMSGIGSAIDMFTLARKFSLSLIGR